MHDRAERLALVLEAIAATDSKIASHRTAPFTPRCPGRPDGPGPESIFTACGYGFRARRFAAPRNDGVDGPRRHHRARLVM
jgi:hypothetical protein